MDFYDRHRNLFNMIYKQKTYNGKNPLVKKIANLARIELGYSEKTIDIDILYGFYKFFK